MFNFAEKILFYRKYEKKSLMCERSEGEPKIQRILTMTRGQKNSEIDSKQPKSTLIIPQLGPE